MNYFLKILPFCFLFYLSSCKVEQTDLPGLDAFTEHQMVTANQDLTRVMVADIFTPPVCSRIYAYPNIAAYEVFASVNMDMPTLSGILNDLEEVPTTEKEIYLPLASMISFTTAARGLVFGQENVDTMRIKYLEKIKKIGISEKLYSNSIEYGELVGNHILAWSGKDGYLERTAKAEYSPSGKTGKWKPTPPDYMPAIEPYWNTIRPFLLDSARQFPSAPPTDFSLNKNSTFYKETMEVFETVKNLDEEKLAIAKFWDCNPNVSHTKGHLMFFDQKISPGGHWMSISGIALKKKNASLEESVKVLAYTGVCLADAFIACWDEKYRSSLVRPETYINEHIDKEWKPILQTPAFPEHTSGHSVASAAASTMLTHLLGDNFSFHDDTEVEWGLPARDFNSFNEAADQAAISRLYGGIHYMPAIESGVTQGKKIGNYCIGKLPKIESGKIGQK